MRKAQKQGVLDIINTIYEAHDFVKKYVDNKDVANAQAMMAECQNTAIELGKIIEKSEGEDFHTIRLIEEYCELLYNVAQEIEPIFDANKIEKIINKKLIEIENSVKDDIKGKIEVVFMPYKASMWDSLESVWKAADEDENCDAYVVPIPYYDRNADGSFGQFHYEGHEFPKNVPIVSYESYNLELRRPDIIYIHNPYDGNNLVTSVAPQFYCTELKKYTDMLVYIPYFVLSDMKPDEITRIKKIEHFCLTQGVVSSDRVIVQSEDMKQIYIDTLQKYFGDKAGDRKALERKILGLGSPKNDKVLLSKVEDFDIPEDWENIIKKSNGENKKVILYNISIASLLEKNEKMIDKIKSVLSFFYENKDEYTLLWRPHPLIRATIESMRPQLWKEYKEIVDKYINEGWGIYDDTADLNRAIAISDAYYGDHSSVVNLYLKTGKLVMIQNCDVTNYEGDIKIDFEDFEIVDNELWFSARDFNGIFRVDLINGEIKYVGILPNELYYKSRLCVKLIRIHEKIIFIPTNANNIWIYNRNSKEWSELPIKPITNAKDNHKFFQIVKYKEFIYLIGANYPAIIKLDTKTNEIKYIDDMFTKLKNKKEEVSDVFFYISIVQKEEYLYLASCVSNEIFKFNMETYDYEVYEVGDSNNRYSGIAWDGNNFWLSPRVNNVVIKWDGNETYEEFILGDEFNRNIFNFHGIIYDGTNLIMPGLEKDATIYINPNNSDKIKIERKKYNFMKILDNSMLVFQDSDSRLVIVDLMTKKETKYDVGYTKEEIKNSLRQSLKEIGSKKIREVDGYTLKELCEDISLEDSKSQNNFEICGRKIHDFIKNCLGK